MEFQVNDNFADNLVAAEVVGLIALSLSFLQGLEMSAEYFAGEEAQYYCESTVI